MSQNGNHKYKYTYNIYIYIYLYNLEEGPPFGEERFAQRESPPIVIVSCSPRLKLCVSWGACKKQGASKVSEKHVKIGGHYRHLLFECLLQENLALCLPKLSLMQEAITIAGDSCCEVSPLQMGGLPLSYMIFSHISYPPTLSCRR